MSAKNKPNGIKYIQHRSGQYRLEHVTHMIHHGFCVKYIIS